MFWGCASETDGFRIPPFVPCPALPATVEGPIEVVGDGFVLAGRAVEPHGVGSYPLLQHVGRGEIERVRDIFAQAHSLGRPLIRTNAFMDGGNNPGRTRDDDGVIREEGLVALDTLLSEAEAAEVRLLLVLTNNWSDFGGAPLLTNVFAPDQPKDAFWSDPDVVNAHLEFLRTLLSRQNTVTGTAYASDPNIFAWELANEPRCTTDGYCDADTLVTWAATMADALREAGAQQPVAWGGSGHVDRYGEQLRVIAEAGGVDILTVHVYPEVFHPELLELPARRRVEAAIEAGAMRILETLDIARDLEMPILLEEFGWRPPEGAARDAERAEVYEGWLSIAHAEGIPTLPWMIGETDREDFDGFLVRPGDQATWRVLGCE